MNRYRVYAGVARLGPNAVVLLSPAQIATREHHLELPAKVDKDAKEILVKTKAAIEFKVGEVIGLDDLPRNLVGVCEPLGEPVTKADQLAVEKAKDHKRQVAEKRHADKKKKR